MVRLVRGSFRRRSAREFHSVRVEVSTQTAVDDCDYMFQTDRERRAKEEKIRIAIQKIKAADIKKVRPGTPSLVIVLLTRVVMPLLRSTGILVVVLMVVASCWA